MTVGVSVAVPSELDHIVIAGPDLAALVAWFEERTGIAAPAGGRHPTGTANHLVALTVGGRRGPVYLELIGPDPEASADGPPSTFGIDALTEPTIATYSIHSDGIAEIASRARAAGVDVGPVEALSRRTTDGVLLEWQLTRGGTAGPAVPFLIDWGETAHPGLGDLPTLELVAFERIEPESAAAAAVDAVSALGLPTDATAAVVPAAPGSSESRFRLTLRTADGRTVEL